MGFLYLTKEFCHKTGLKSPVRWEDYDGYGKFAIKVGPYTTIDLDYTQLCCG